MHYPVERPEVLNPNVRVIDYVSLKLSQSGVASWMRYLDTLGFQARSPWVTVCYSAARVQDFPIQSLEGELIEPLTTPLSFDLSQAKYHIFVDPYGTRHLVLLLAEDSIKQLHRSYIARGATWDFEAYHPHITLESDTLVLEQDLLTLPILTGLWHFEYITHSRFGEVIACDLG